MTSGSAASAPETSATEGKAARRTWLRADAALLALLVVLLGALGVKDIAAGTTSAEMFAHPFQFDESESMIVAETMLLDRGTDIYDKPGPDLFVSAPYPPLFYVLNWPLQHLAGSTPTFKAGRAITILATILVGLAILGIVRAVAGDWLAGVVGAAAFWSLGLVTFWGSLVKPDMLAVLLGMAGVLWALARPPSQVWWALLLFLAAFYTKQTAIAGAVATTGWLLVTRWRTGLGFGAALAAGAALPSLALNWWTNGGYFWHEFTIHDLPWFRDRFVMYVGDFLESYGAMVVPGMLALVALGALWLWAKTKRGEQYLTRDAGLLVALYLVMTLVEATGTGTHGGNHNHLLDWAAVSCLGVGLGIAVLRRLPPWQAKAVLAAGLLLLIAQVPGLFGVPSWLRTEFAQLSPDKVEGMRNVFQYVANAPGQAYSDNVGLLLSAGKRLWTTDPFTQTHATKYGRWDQSKLLDAFRRKQFSQVILRIDVDAPDAGAGDTSPEILQLLRDNYKLDQRNVENIYVPR